MRHQKAINLYKMQQKTLGNDVDGKDRFKPNKEFYEMLLDDLSNVRSFRDVYETNLNENYVIIDLLDDIGLYKITIEKLA